MNKTLYMPKRIHYEGSHCDFGMENKQITNNILKISGRVSIDRSKINTLQGHVRSHQNLPAIN